VSQFEEILSKINTIASKLRKLFGNPKEVVTIDRIFINITTAYSSKISEVLTSEIHGKIPDYVFRKAIEALNALSNMVDRVTPKLSELIRTKLINISIINYGKGSAELRYARLSKDNEFILLYRGVTPAEFIIEVRKDHFLLSDGRHKLNVSPAGFAEIYINEGAGIIKNVCDLFKRIVNTYVRDDMIKLYESVRRCYNTLNIVLPTVVKDNTKYEVVFSREVTSLDIIVKSPHNKFKYSLWTGDSIAIEEPLDLKLLEVAKETVDVITRRADDIKNITCITIPGTLFTEKTLKVKRDNIEITFEPLSVTTVDTATGDELKLTRALSITIKSKTFDRALDFGKKAIREIFRAGAIITLYP